MKLILLAWVLPLIVGTSVLMGEETRPISGSLEGLEGLLAQPLMVKEAMPRRLLGVGISHRGTVYVTDTISRIWTAGRTTGLDCLRCIMQRTVSDLCWD